jgi:hypothetical protein
MKEENLISNKKCYWLTYPDKVHSIKYINYFVFITANHYFILLLEGAF